MRSRAPRYTFAIPVYKEESGLALLFPQREGMAGMGQSR